MSKKFIYLQGEMNGSLCFPDPPTGTGKHHSDPGKRLQTEPSVTEGGLKWTGDSNSATHGNVVLSLRCTIYLNALPLETGLVFRRSPSTGIVLTSLFETNYLSSLYNHRWESYGLKAYFGRVHGVRTGYTHTHTRSPTPLILAPCTLWKLELLPFCVL